MHKSNKYSLIFTSLTMSIGIGGILLALFIIAIAFMLRDHEVDCDKDPPIFFEYGNEGKNASIDSCFAFSETYFEAREKFRGTVKTLYPESPLLTYNVIDDYTMDIVIIKGNVPGTVVHTSAIHGVEGYAGASIQLSFLKYVLPNIIATNEQRPTIIIVHAVNPYGMAKYRRANENNVDPNRDGLTDEQWTEVMKRHPNIAGYDDFDKLFNVPRAPTLFDYYIKFWLLASKEVSIHGISKLKTAMVTGQYHKPDGIFYGGGSNGPMVERSLYILQKIFWKPYVDDNKDSLGCITWVDVHTGLGKLGEDTLIVETSDTDTHGQQNSKLHKKLKKWFPNIHIPPPTSTGSSGDSDNSQIHNDDSTNIAKDVVGGYHLAMGQTTKYVTDGVPGEHNMIAMNQEFGTLHPLKVAHALVLENMAYQHLADDESKTEWAKRTTRRAFYVRTTYWRNSIVKRGLNLLLQSMKRSINEEST